MGDQQEKLESGTVLNGTTLLMTDLGICNTILLLHTAVCEFVGYLK